MTSSFTVGKGDFEKPANGDYVDTWNVPTNANYDAIDACLSASVTVTSTGGTVNLTQANMRSQRIIISGTLTSNLTVNFYPGINGLYTVVSNGTQGAFTITMGQNNLLTVTIPPNTQHTLVFCDGASVFLADPGGAAQTAATFVPPGAIMDFAMSSAPTGWLVCNGIAISRAAFLPLFTNIGTTWGVGNGSTTFNLPNFQGRFRRTWDQSGIVDPARAFASLQADAFKTHTHGVSDPQHNHTVPVIAGVNQAGFNNSSPLGGGAAAVTTSSSATGITIQSAGDTETRPTNYAVLTCIKT